MSPFAIKTTEHSYHNDYHLPDDNGAVSIEVISPLNEADWLKAINDHAAFIGVTINWLFGMGVKGAHHRIRMVLTFAKGPSSLEINRTLAEVTEGRYLLSSYVRAEDLSRLDSDLAYLPF